MNYERQKRLVERLLAKTRAGGLPWQEGVSENSFQVNFPSSSAQIRHIDNKYTSEYQIYVLNSNGQATDIFDSCDLERDGPSLSDSWYILMDEIFASARRKALRADEAIDSILAEIG